MKRGQKASTPSSDKDREDEIEEESTIGNSTRQTLAFYISCFGDLQIHCHALRLFRWPLVLN